MGQLQNWQDVIRSHEFIKHVAVVEEVSEPSPGQPPNSGFDQIFVNCRQNFFSDENEETRIVFWR
jgi:hypothetical protein